MAAQAAEAAREAQRIARGAAEAAAAAEERERAAATAAAEAAALRAEREAAAALERFQRAKAEEKALEAEMAERRRAAEAAAQQEEAAARKKSALEGSLEERVAAVERALREREQAVAVEEAHAQTESQQQHLADSAAAAAAAVRAAARREAAERATHTVAEITARQARISPARAVSPRPLHHVSPEAVAGALSPHVGVHAAENAAEAAYAAAAGLSVGGGGRSASPLGVRGAGRPRSPSPIGRAASPAPAEQPLSVPRPSEEAAKVRCVCRCDCRGFFLSLLLASPSGDPFADKLLPLAQNDVAGSCRSSRRRPGSPRRSGRRPGAVLAPGPVRSDPAAGPRRDARRAVVVFPRRDAPAGALLPAAGGARVASIAPGRRAAPRRQPLRKVAVADGAGLRGGGDQRQRGPRGAAAGPAVRRLPAAHREPRAAVP